MVVESRSVIRNAKNAWGLGRGALFSLCSFFILSESLAQARRAAQIVSPMVQKKVVRLLVVSIHFLFHIHNVHKKGRDA